MSKGSAIVGFILCFLGGMGLMWGIDRGAGHGAQGHAAIGKEAHGQVLSADHASASVPVSKDDPSWGSPNAPVTIVEFSNFQCGYCKKVGTTLDALKKKYGPEQLRIVWKNSPAPRATNTHVAAMTVNALGGSEAFWKFHDLAFADFRGQTDENFANWAAQVGVDKAKFEAAYKAKSAAKKVEDDTALSRALGVRGTPGFFINGVAVRGAQPQQQFEEEVDKQLAAAKQLAASGTKPGEIYVALTNQNKAKVDAAPGSEKAAEAKAKPEDTTTVWKVPVLDTDPIKGPKHALVTIVEFSEFECPFCSRVLPTVNQIRETYGDKVRVVWKDNPLPFHKRANPASQLAREAQAQKGDEGFWKAHDLLFQNQKALGDEDLAKYAEQLGLDVDKAKKAIADQKYNELIEAAQEIAQDFNASGTPHFFVNGRRLVGAKPFADFKTIIDEEIAKAEGLLKGGTKLEGVYDALVKDGKAPPPPEKKNVGAAPADAPFKGAKDAKVVIHEFSDFQCPFCRRVNGTIQQILDNHGDQVKVVWRHKPLPFHKEAPLAHEATLEAYAQKGNEGFWAMHDKLFENQKKLGRADLDGYAKELGLDVDKFKKALDERTHKARMEEDIAVADKAGIRGTPGFVVGEYFVSGAQPYGKFKKLIKLAIDEAAAKK